MKRIASVLLLTLFAMWPAAAPAGQHGSSAAGLVDIPFKFVVGDRLLPQGIYQIWSESSDWETMKIAPAGSKEVVARVRTLPTVRRAPNDGKVHVQFDSYYGQHFLVWIGLPFGDGHEVEMTRARAARALMRLNLMPAEPADVSKR